MDVLDDKWQYTPEQAAQWDYPDYTGDENLEVRPSKRKNRTEGYRKLHIIDLNKIRNGWERRMWAIYGVPVGWGSNDDAPENHDRYVSEIQQAKNAGQQPYQQALSKYGFLNEEHFEWVWQKISDRREGAADEAAMKQAADDALKASQAQAQQQFDANQEALQQGGEFDPVQGISLEQWASMQASIASGQPADQIIGQWRVDKPTWDAVSAEWNARMSRDTTATIATVYGKAFTGGGMQPPGAAPAQNAAPAQQAGPGEVTFEKWVEITEAQNAAAQQGVDAASVLAKFGMTPADWGNVSAKWAQAMSTDPMKYAMQFSELSAKYREKYASAGAGSDIDF